MTDAAKAFNHSEVDCSPQSEEPRKHSKFSPSGWGYLAKCPSFRKEEGATNAIAELGTRAHKAVETRNLEGLDDQYIEAVRKCIALEDEKALNADEVLTEVQLEMCGQKGFVDVAMRQGSTARLIDYKFGFNQVEPAETNFQAFGYLIGLWELWPQVNEIEVTFFMPFLNIQSEHTFSRKDDYVRIKLTAEQLLIEAEKAEAQYPNEYCIYCAMRNGRCQAITNKYSLIAQRYDSLPVPLEVHSSQITDPAKMAQLLPLAELAKEWGESVKKHARDMAISGQKLPGYELSERSGVREITNVEAAWPILKGYLAEHELLGAVKVSYGDLEKLVSDKAVRGEKSKTLIQLQNALTENDALEKRAPVYVLKKTKNQKIEKTINI